MAAVQLYEAAEVQNIQRGFQTTGTGALRQHYELELERDRIERDAEVLIWKQPGELRRQRSEIADQLAAAEAEARKASRQNGLSDAGIANQKDALARIDARLKQLGGDHR